MKKLTADHLRTAGACEGDLERFYNLHPDGLDLTPANACLLASEFGSVDLASMGYCLIMDFAPEKVNAFLRYRTQARAERTRALNRHYARYGSTKTWPAGAAAEEDEIQRRYREKIALGAAWFLGGADDPS